MKCQASLPLTLALMLTNGIPVQGEQFSYVDPVDGVLEAQGALEEYRDRMDEFYLNAVQSNNKFVRIERLPASAHHSPVQVFWKAFPKTANASNRDIDRKRFQWQDEYVEWSVEREGGLVKRVVFTTELPDHFAALAEVSAEALIAGIQDAIPGAQPTVEELFGTGFNLANSTPKSRSSSFLARTVVPFRAGGAAGPPNPWNNGQKGFLCLGQRFNTTGALFNLARACSIPVGGAANAVCASTGGACGPRRASDPAICERVQSESRKPVGLSLADPAGIRIHKLEGTWRLNGQVIDINDPTVNQGVWKVSRNGRRATLEVSPTLTLNRDAIVTGAQVSRFLQVVTKVVAASEDQLGALSEMPVPLLEAPALLERTRE